MELSGNLWRRDSQASVPPAAAQPVGDARSPAPPAPAAGPSQCDKRQALEETRQQFPGVDFRCAPWVPYGSCAVPRAAQWQRLPVQWMPFSAAGRRRPARLLPAASPCILPGRSLIGSELDTSWEAGHVESESSVVVRGFEFLNWLMQVRGGAGLAWPGVGAILTEREPAA